MADALAVPRTASGHLTGAGRRKATSALGHPKISNPHKKIILAWLRGTPEITNPSPIRTALIAANPYISLY